MQRDPHIPIPSFTESSQPLLSVVVPAFNECQVLPLFHERLSAVLDKMPLRSEIIYVNDGSYDGTLGVMENLQMRDPRVALIDLSRNFGKEIALTAGLDHAGGDGVIIIDADLQDPPELIPELVKYWLEEGFDVVYAKRTARDSESLVKRASAYAFYRIIRLISKVPIPEDTGDFRLISRRACHSLRQLREQHRFMKGLFAWIGYPQKMVPYHRDPRHSGKSKWNYWKLWNFSLEGITSFTSGPLKISTYLGMTIALGAFLFAAFIIFKKLFYGDPVPGYPSLMVVILFLGGVQLISIGIVGEYLGRMFDEAKQRPLYLVKGYQPSKSGKKDPDL